MRAIYLENIDKDIKIEGEDAHHLIKVVRIKEGEEILVLDGKGKRVITTVLKVEKNSVILNIFKVEKIERPDRIHLVIGLPKKEAFEEVLRFSSELGISKIFYFKSQFSQLDFILNERVKRLLISSIIQSNNPYFPILENGKDLNSLQAIFSEYNKVIYFCSHSNLPSDKKVKIDDKDKVLLIIGPEGGFSKEEESILANNNMVSFCHLPTFILRTPTAVAASVGWILST